MAATARWRRDNDAVVAGSRDPRCLVLRYEDLVANPEEHVRTICDHIGLPFHPEMLEYWRSAPNWFGAAAVPSESTYAVTRHNSHRNWQVHQPISADSVGRFRRELSTPEIVAVETACFPLAAAFGYEAEMSGS
jgi:hypothetical protein